METTGQWKSLKNRWKVDENQLKTQHSNNDFHFGPVKIQPFGSCSVGNRLRRTRQMRWWMRLFDFFGPKRNWVELVMPEEHILSITWDHEKTILLLHQSYLEWNRSSDLDLRISFSFSEEKFSLGWAALNSNFHSVFKNNKQVLFQFLHTKPPNVGAFIASVGEFSSNDFHQTWTVCDFMVLFFVFFLGDWRVVTNHRRAKSWQTRGVLVFSSQFFVRSERV